MAEQQQPVVRKVALKIIKPGMDTKEVIARFEAERQALALMDHPNIARVFDGGSTDSGRPYFVMELVRGIPITDYCDRENLTATERLDLFVSVCNAVQHAHQKGIIHRDVKPTNVLVTIHDAEPVVKVIDFGVAKATNQRLTEKTLFTRFSQMVGTPLYMSPEQAELSNLDVDTRSDIYSLGVLLYELLTGTTPFDRERFMTAAHDEIRRIIIEEEPRKPSTRISTLGDSLTAVCTHRKTEPKQLTRLISGDLDWIVMKALEKKRSRRYETATGLAADVKRYLGGEPIEARPPSTVYRLRKVASRHRGALTTAAIVAVTLLAATVTSTWMAVYAIDQKQRAEKMAAVARQQAAEASQNLRMFATASYEKAVRDVLINDQQQAQRGLDVAEMAGVSTSQIQVLKGLMALNRGENDVAMQHANEAVELTPDSVGPRALRTVAYIWSGYDDRGELELHHLRQLTPQSDADRLLLAYAFVSSDPREAKHLLAGVPGMERSPVGLVVRGFVNLIAAWRDKDAKAAERAASDFEYVQFFFNENPASLAFRLDALESCVRLTRSEGRNEAADCYEKTGRLLAEQLTEAKDYPAGDWTRQRFYRAIGEDEKAWQAIRNVGQHPGTYSWFLAAHCLERYGVAAIDEFNKAIASEHKNSKYVRLARAYLLGGMAHRAQEVRSLVEDMLNDPSPFLRRHALLALCPVCQPSEIQELASGERTTISGIWDDVDCLDYLAGRINERDLLEKTRRHETPSPDAYFTVAMMRLAAGDDQGAREYFEKCVETEVAGFFDCAWARAFLARMESDETGGEMGSGTSSVAE